MCTEYYFACHAPEATSPGQAIQILHDRFTENLKQAGFAPESPVLLRFFCSDVYTQTPLIRQTWRDSAPCQHIFIGQAPLDSSYISLQVYGISARISKEFTPDGSLRLRHGGYSSLYTLDYPKDASSSQEQSDEVILSLQKKLQTENMSLGLNILRTWYYIRDVDNNYAGMIRSRIEHYESQGLTPQTHFFASTGIEACAPHPNILVWLHSYAQSGLQPKQITYLKALDWLSPTHIYGVNFERATRVTYGDRLHCHISGTASIDHAGNVLHIGDPVRQFERAIENIEALLHEGNMVLQDLKAATIYLRDIHDYPRIAELSRKLLPAGCAINITHGAVCRPDWLVEIEGEAIRSHNAPYPPFID